MLRQITMLRQLDGPHHIGVISWRTYLLLTSSIKVTASFALSTTTATHDDNHRWLLQHTTSCKAQSSGTMAHRSLAAVLLLASLFLAATAFSVEAHTTNLLLHGTPLAYVSLLSEVCCQVRCAVVYTYS